MNITISGDAREFAEFARHYAAQAPRPSTAEENAIYFDRERRDDTWRRFELIAPEELKDEFYETLVRLNPSRRELAVLVSSLRVRPGFSLSDFDT